MPPAIRTGFRFRPPAVHVDAVTDWLLTRALGPPNMPLGRTWSGRSPHGLLRKGAKLGLLERIRRRNRTNLLVAEIGAERLDELDGLVQAAAVIALVQEQCARSVAHAAAELGVSLLFLKGMALQLTDVTKRGARPAGDIDVLVAPGDADALFSLLNERGYRDSGLPAPHHHLPRLRHESNTTLEVHDRLRGVRLSTSAEARMNDCLDGGHCVRVDSLPGSTYVPSRALTRAHLLVHSIDQHGMAPESYRSLRLFGDLEDLGVIGGQGNGLLGHAMSWIEQSVSGREVDAVDGLLAHLQAGGSASDLAPTNVDAALLLRHCLAGCDDEDYRRVLTVRRELQASPNESRVAAVTRHAVKALVLTRVQVDELYGPPKSNLGYLARRLWRPFELIGRLIASGRSTLRLQARGKQQ